VRRTIAINPGQKSLNLHKQRHLQLQYKNSYVPLHPHPNQNIVLIDPADQAAKGNVLVDQHVHQKW
jgi:hypothetical protein